MKKSFPPRSGRGRDVSQATSRPTDLDGRRSSGLLRLIRRPETGAFVAVVGVFTFFAFTAGANGFLTLAGTASWLDTAAELGIVAIPVGMLMIGGEFDLSVGSVVGASSMIFAVSTTQYGWPLWVAVLLCLAFGLCVGLINGLIVTRNGLPSFIVTLATMLAIAGAALGVSVLISGTTTITVAPYGAVKAAFATQIHGFNISVFWWLVIALLGTWVLTKTRFGNWVYAVGGHLETATFAGVPTKRVKIALFMASATGAVLAGLTQTIEFGGGEVGQGQNFVYDCIIASVIGGVLLAGGYGSAIGVSLGAATYGMVNIGIFYTGWDTNWAQLFLGLLLLRRC